MRVMVILMMMMIPMMPGMMPVTVVMISPSGRDFPGGISPPGRCFLSLSFPSRRGGEKFYEVAPR